MIKNYTRLVYMISVTLCSQFNFSQVGIGTTNPAAGSVLDVTSLNKGVLVPRLNIVDLNTIAPVTGGATKSLLAYNTNATSGEGFYYWNGAKWIGIDGEKDWKLRGNANTNAGTDFMGTTDAQDVVFKANSKEHFRVGQTESVFNETSDNNYNFRIESKDEANLFTVLSATNHVYIRKQSPFPTIDMFISTGAADIYPLNGYAEGQGNSGVYGRHITKATGGNMNAAGAFDGVGTGAGYSLKANWNVGVVATGDQAGIYGSSVSGGINVQGGYFEESAGGTIYASARVAGYDGFQDYGGYFDGGVTGGDYARVGFNDGIMDYKIQGPGSVSTVVRDDQGQNRVLFCPEAPEVLFQDYGVGKLSNGEAYIAIDPILAKNIFVDKKHPLKVFIQLEGDCKGVYVTEKTGKGFRVKELQGGNTNVPFSWSLTASRADRMENGVVKSKHVGIRFPKGQERIVPTQTKSSKVSEGYAGVQNTVRERR